MSAAKVRSAPTFLGICEAGDAQVGALDSVAAAPRNVRIVRERDVAARFGL